MKIRYWFWTGIAVLGFLISGAGITYKFASPVVVLFGLAIGVFGVFLQVRENQRRV